jgi:oxalate---CoA ligase
MKTFSNLTEFLSIGESSRVAITAPGRLPMTFDQLRAQVSATIASLNQFGIGRGDRVAIVLPNGPEMASAFICVAAGATAAPLNPAYRAEEFEFYLTDLKAKALIVSSADDTAARAAAKKLNVTVIDLHADSNSPAGRFSLQADSSDAAPASNGGTAASDDIALILHTSGTTSRPKIVPLTQRNVCASARNVRDTLRFSADDRGLNIMPLFHIHGLIAGLLAPLSAGSQVHCTPGFNALKFFTWMADSKPTWYSAVPTMHQTILSRAANNSATIAANPLRFIRSSSASLPAQVLLELEKVFACPVIESYGMTEAAHQMASNPLPSAKRIPGCVGIAAGPEVAIMDEAGNMLPRESVGEIVIRGENVTLGYENNPKANAEAFTNGWFRTGDQGVMNAEGYLTLTGRLKEIINRGGEKISPREVDDILMDHPAVQQVITFAMPHDKLGEDVAAAVVLRDGASATEKELREFVTHRLADFKVPRKILFLDEIPKGATGKLQRIGLAAKLGLG